MNRYGVAIAVSLCVLAGCSRPEGPPSTLPAQGVAPAPSPPPADSERILKDLELETGRRWKNKDVAFFDELLADGFVWLSQHEPQVLGKKEYLADSANYEVESAEMEEVVVVVSGSTAAVRGRGHNRGTYRGKRFDSTFVFIDTCVWDGARWRILATASLPANVPTATDTTVP